MDCRTALLKVLDQVDYTNGACGVTEMVGAVLPKEVIALARKAIADEAAQNRVQADLLPCGHSKDNQHWSLPEGVEYCAECSATNR